MSAFLLLLMSCSGPGGGGKDGHQTQTTPPTDTALLDSADTGTLPTTLPTTTTVDCEALPDQAQYFTIPVATQEDFDFDGFGYLVHQSGGSIAGMSYYGELRIITPGIGDTAGIQIISTGDIIYASPFSSSIHQINIKTGADALLAGGLDTPDGLEIGAGDRVYYSERRSPGSVRYIDVITHETGDVVTGLDQPNGLAFSPDENTLFIAGGWDATTEGIIAVDKDKNGDWGVPRPVIFADTAAFDGVEVDMCGNVYAVGWSDGIVLRAKPDGTDGVALADLTDGGGGFGLFNSIRWGSGIGGWRRDTLYVTDRSQIYAVSVGVLGRPSPVAIDYTP